MNRLQTLLPLLAASSLALLSGCGTGSNTSALSGTSGSQPGRRAAQITIHWPELSSTRLIPVVAKSIDIVMTAPAISGVTTNAFSTHTLISRPTSGNTSTVTITELPEGSQYTETATAYPNADGTGNAQATGSISGISIKPSQLTKTSDLVMNTTIKSLTVTPSATTAKAGGAAISLTATAKDANGNVVLTAPANIAFSSNKPSLGTLTSGSNPASLTPLAAGTVSITATETESHITSAAVSIVISGGGTTTDNSKIFVADASNNRIVGLDTIPATTFAPFADYNPQAIAFDPQGHLYFSSYSPGSAKIIRVDDITGANQATYAPSGSTASLVAVDKQGRIYFYDDNQALNRIDDITGANLVTYSPTNQFGSHLLNGTTGIAIDSQNRIYLIQGLSGRVMRFDDMTGANTVTFGTQGSDVNQFKFPHGIAAN